MIDLAGIIPATVTPDARRRAPRPRRDPALRGAARSTPVRWAWRSTSTPGEGPHLTRDERRAVLETVVGAAAGRCRVVAGVGGPSTADGVGERAHRARRGRRCAAGVPRRPRSCSTPLRPDVVAAYHQAIADAADLPIVLFQLQPMLGGALLPARGARRAAAIPQVAAIKEASFDPLRWLALRAHLDAVRPRQITLLTGNDNFIAESFLPGRRGRAAGVRDAAHGGARRAAAGGPRGRHRRGRASWARGSRSSRTSSSRPRSPTTGHAPRRRSRCWAGSRARSPARRCSR